VDTAKLIEVSCLIAVVILSLGIHEYGHALVAYLCGDDTAKRDGRMTVNPVAHIDPFMTVLLPAFLYFSTGGRFMFGGARPVPVDPRRLRNPLRDMMLVAIAGPATNVVLAVVFMLLHKTSLTYWEYGREELMPRVLEMSSLLNLNLAVFNMLPIPPLDGSRVMAYLLPHSLRDSYVGLERFGLLLVIVFIFFVPGVRESVRDTLYWLYFQLDEATGGEWRR
jgi:Zn-dependent protease